MENLAFAPQLLDLFGEQVIIQRRSFERRPRRKLPNQGQVQLGFHDILEMSDAELEALRAQDEITDDYVYWLREYLLKLTLRQLIHPQVSAATRAEAMTRSLRGVTGTLASKKLSLIYCALTEPDWHPKCPEKIPRQHRGKVMAIGNELQMNAKQEAARGNDIFSFPFWSLEKFMASNQLTLEQTEYAQYVQQIFPERNRRRFLKYRHVCVANMAAFMGDVAEANSQRSHRH